MPNISGERHFEIPKIYQCYRVENPSRNHRQEKLHVDLHNLPESDGSGSVVHINVPFL